MARRGGLGEPTLALVFCPVNSFAKSLDFLEYGFGSCGPRERLAIAVVMGNELLDFPISSRTPPNDPRRIALSVIRAKKRSTWLSQLAEVGV